MHEERFVWKEGDIKSLNLSDDDRGLFEFVERRIRNQVCPQCGSNEVACVLRGMPSYSKGLELLLDRKKVVLGGCVLDLDDKDLCCTLCEHEFNRKRYRKPKD